MFLTPNGRFELHKKVCLSITGYHPEYWQPAWGIRTVLVAVMGFLPTQSKGAIGGLDTSVEARKALAIRSKTWTCSTCRQENIAILPDVAPEDVVKASLKADEMPPEFSFGYEADKKKQQEDDLQDKSKSSSSSTGDGKEQQEATTEAGQASALPAQTQTHTQTQAHTQAPTLASATPSSLTSTSSLSSSSSPLPSPSVTGAAAAAAVSLAATSSAPRDPPRPPVSQSPAELRQRTMTPQSTQRHAAGRAQMPTLTQTQVGHARSNSPWWLDALIFAFGGILVALVLRRFL
ncbi:Ubiquitin-conjugating enzyme E2 J1 [Dissophora globulifera]|uniref:Ubiquitin-conjugating enzyme E2 J1 n=1 Tax=Dissophora globulifera TaxID=979702 RepID=A0A9P6RPI5_9FUNG|nr:Ubiquitin-conjugating enzyme E2 J1 [Dissophora globulifera]